MDISQQLRSNGYKVTPQRVAIYKALYNYVKHPSAEMIHSYLHEKYPSISLATVYKTMEIFGKIGLVTIIDVGAGSCLYDCVTTPHPHVYCLECGKVDDILGIDLDELVNKAESISKYQIKQTQIVFQGICDKCLEKKN